MNTQYRFIENINENDFNKLAFKDGVKSHFLGSVQWGKVSAKRGWSVHYVGMEKDGELVATALLLQKPLLLGYSYFYIPRGFTMDYNDKETLKEFTKAIDNYCKKHKSIYFKIDPDIKLHTIDLEGNVIEGEDNYALVEYLKSIGYKHRPLNYYFEGEQPRFTFRIPLDDEIEEIEKKYSRTTKSRIKQSKKYGVEVVEGTKDDVDQFCRLMTMTEKRKDFFSHEKDFYHFFYDLFDEQDMVTLYLGIVDVPKIANKLEEDIANLNIELAKFEGNDNKRAINKCKELKKQIVALEKQQADIADKPREKVVVSAYLITNYDDKAWALYAGNDMNYGKFFANYAVYEKQIQEAKKKGLKIFDVFGTIGKPDGDSKLAGLYEFKKKWGGEYTEFIGEFEYIENKFMYTLYKTLIPYYHKIVNKRLRKRTQNGN